MPTNFLSEDQRRRFGRFAEDPDEGQLAGSFLLDQTARRRAMTAKGPGAMALPTAQSGSPRRSTPRSTARSGPRCSRVPPNSTRSARDSTPTPSPPASSPRELCASARS
ncbi:hypothetical protein NKH18_18900 [Streptomyces sp. M10(2022)]